MRGISYINELLFDLQGKIIDNVRMTRDYEFVVTFTDRSKMRVVPKEFSIEPPVETTIIKLREYEKTSQEGLRDGYTRATFIVREDLLKKLKDYAYTERETLKDVVNKMLAEFLESKEVIEKVGDAQCRG